MKAWAGRRVALLVALVLDVKGRTCHLCGYPGANSADHDPPRQDLIDEGVADPDALAYLFPAHLLCNKRRQRRPITSQLRDELATRRRADLDRAAATASLSPRLAKRRPFFESRPGSGRNSFLPPPPKSPRKKSETSRP